MIDVLFQHWQHEFSDSELKYSSPHFDSHTASKSLVQSVASKASRICHHHLSFSPSQIQCANEAFPESAIADPLADLALWDEWQSGKRSFPYLGRYSRLGIVSQKPKNQSKSTVGVLGEIMAGLFAQAYVGPLVLVRVIDRWPDFIFYNKPTGLYSFVESKASTGPAVGLGEIGKLISQKLLGECLYEAILQLNTDSNVTVWGAFTKICNVDPMKLEVTFLELNLPGAKRTKLMRTLPPAVVSSLAERTVSRAASELVMSGHIEREIQKNQNLKSAMGGSKKRNENLAEIVTETASNYIEEMLIDAGPEAALSGGRKEIEEEIKSIAAKGVKEALAISAETLSEGKKFREILHVSSPGILAQVRRSGDKNIYMSKLPPDFENDRLSNWEADWKMASTSFATHGQMKLWRCGGAVFGMGDIGLDGQRVDEV